MKGTFTGTGTAFTGATGTYVKGGENKEGLLWLDFGTGTVTLEVSTDEGANWVVDSTYTADTAIAVKFLGSNAWYTLNCTVYTADIDYSLGT